MEEVEDVTIEEVVDRIISVNPCVNNFWTTSSGWAPLEAAKLLTQSRLDWQVALSECLKIWLKDISKINETGRLILAWANLGSLVEGTMKLFLSVWYESYKADIEVVRRKGKIISPDNFQLEPLCQFFRKRIWRDDDEWNAWINHIQINHIQHRRNAIYTFGDRSIGGFDEFRSDIRIYLSFLQNIDTRHPYPNDILGNWEIGK